MTGKMHVNRNGRRRSKPIGVVAPALKLSGKRAVVGQNSEKLIFSTEGANELPDFLIQSLGAIESLRFINREK